MATHGCDEQCCGAATTRTATDTTRLPVAVAPTATRWQHAREWMVRHASRYIGMYILNAWKLQSNFLVLLISNAPLLIHGC